MIGEDRPRILSRITHNRQQHTRTGHIGEGRIGGGEQGEGSPGEGSPTGILARIAQDRGPHTPPGHMRPGKIKDQGGRSEGRGVSPGKITPSFLLTLAEGGGGSRREDQGP